MINKSKDNNQSPTFFILGCEQSADNHGAVLMKSIKKLKPNSNFVGIGGDKMQSMGLKSIEKIDKLAIMGFIEVIKHISLFNKLTKKILDKIKFSNPVQIILIDYPGFNLRLAKKIKKNFNIPITYYISPQIWAWKENRIRNIRKYVDQMLVIFPFEKKWYKERGIDVEFIGHPVFDEWTPTSKNDLCISLNISSNKPIITLFPGSRKQELNKHLPVFIKTAERMNNNNIQFILGLAPELSLENFKIPKWIHIENRYPQKALECADLALVASGTATLEAAVFGTPMIIIYKMSILSWWLTKLLVKTEHAGIVNIIAEEKIMPEFLQNEANEINIANKAIEIINNNNVIEEMKLKLLNVKQKLGTTGASDRAARHILSLLILNEN